jgi:hypothetical protein
MQRSLQLEGEVIDRQTYLDGTREFNLEATGGPDAEGPWRLTLSFRWPKEAAGPDEGDLSLTDPPGSALYGTLSEGAAEDVYDEDTASDVLHLSLDFEIRSGEDAFAGWTGRAHVAGRVSGEQAALTVEIAAAPDGAG